MLSTKESAIVKKKVLKGSGLYHGASRVTASELADETESVGGEQWAEFKLGPADEFHRDLQGAG